MIFGKVDGHIEWKNIGSKYSVSHSTDENEKVHKTLECDYNADDKLPLMQKAMSFNSVAIVYAK